MTCRISNNSLLWHFAIPVYSRQLEGFEPLRQELLKLIIQKRDAFFSQRPDEATNPTWHSSNDLHLWQEPCIPEVVALISQFASEAIGAMDPSQINANIIMNECWATVGAFGAGTSPHNHFPSNWSGQFYLSVDDCIKDEHEKFSKMEFVNPMPVAKSFGQPERVLYQPKDGLLLLFPALAEHMVHPNMTQNLRVLISFNMSVQMPQHSHSSKE